MAHRLLSVMLFVATMSAAAQSGVENGAVMVDSIEVASPAATTDALSGGDMEPVMPNGAISSVASTSRYVPATLAYPINPLATTLPPLGFTPGVANIASWGSGGVYADGGRAHLQGLMGIETGSVNFMQQMGPVTVTLFGSTTKYGYFRGLSTTYGFGGALTYRFSDNLSMTVFGSYNSAAGITQPAMMGYVSTPVFGGYLDWRFHPHWGVKAGAQSYRSIAYGRWETQPMVIPYYRTSSGAEIGIDVGGIIYQVIRSAASGNGSSNWGNPGNPTIDPRPTGVFIRPRD